MLEDPRDASPRGLHAHHLLTHLPALHYTPPRTASHLAPLPRCFSHPHHTRTPPVQQCLRLRPSLAFTSVVMVGVSGSSRICYLILDKVSIFLPPSAHLSFIFCHCLATTYHPHSSFLVKHTPHPCTDLILPLSPWTPSLPRWQITFTCTCFPLIVFSIYM